MIAADGSAVAVRGENGRLAMVKSGSDVFAWREWLAADADARNPKDPTLREGMRCDAHGCIGRLRDGAFVAIPKTIEAFEEDCRRAVLVVSGRDAPPGYDRPWARAATQASDAPEPRRTPSAAAAPARDATPRDEDLEAGD